MTKPFSPSELVARVKAHINRYESLTEKSSEKTAYEIYRCDWSSDVCSSDLGAVKFLSMKEAGFFPQNRTFPPREENVSILSRQIRK